MKTTRNNFPPRSKFESWIRNYGGTKKLAEEIGVTQTTVQMWLRKFTKPSIVKAQEIIVLSKNKVTLKDIVDATY